MSKPLLLFVTATVLFAVVQLPPASGSSDARWDFYCAGGNFTPHSQYSILLDAVAAQLPERVAASSLLYATETHGEEAAVHSIAQCQRDTSKSKCKRCLERSFQDAQQVCQYQEGAFIFRDGCTLGYYNKELVLSPEDPSVDAIATKVDQYLLNVHSALFDSAVVELANSVARSASTSAKRFATGQKEFAGVECDLKIYALAQCLPSLSADECDSCIATLFDMVLTQNMTAGRGAKVWCSFRYSPEKFFTGKPMLDLLVNGPSPLPTPAVEDKHKRHKHIPLCVWLAIALGGATLLIATIGLACWCRKKRRQRNMSSAADERGSQVECSKGKASAFETCPSAIDGFDQIIQQANTREISLFLDYDGTLSPIVKDPALAYMSDEMRAVLQKLAILFKTSVVSGRARDKVFDFVKIEEINYAGSHGMDIKVASTKESASTSGKETVEDSYQPAKEHLAVINQVFNILRAATREITGANIENNVYCVSLHYRNVASQDMPRIQQVVDNVLDEMKDAIKLTFGHKVYEFRPPVDWNKGHAVLYLLRELGLQDSFPIYIGDDVTDEDAFEVIRKRNTGVGILVSEQSRKTSAFFSLKDPSQVMEFLHLLVSWKEAANKSDV